MHDFAKFQLHQIADDEIVIIFGPPVLRLFHVVFQVPLIMLWIIL